MDTQEYSDFDSDSGEEWLNDMRNEEQEEDSMNNSTRDPGNTSSGKILYS